MPFLRQSLVKKFTPKSVKFSDIYKHGLKTKELSNTDTLNAKKALEKSGFTASETNKILGGKEISILEAKKVAEKMSAVGLGGFGQDAKKLVNQYVRQEAIKKKNIAARRTELMQESLQEDIYQQKQRGSITSPSSSGNKIKNNNKPKLGF